MFDIGSSEFLLIVIVAVIVIGPKDLPRALYKVGQIVGKARAMARHFRSGIDAMVREVELEELEKKWAAENRRIMAEHPSPEADATPALPQPDPDAEVAASAFPGFPPPGPEDQAAHEPAPEPAPKSVEPPVAKDGAAA